MELKPNIFPDHVRMSDCFFGILPQQLKALGSQPRLFVIFWKIVFPTAASFGVSAQIGSGVVGGDPELRFHQGSTRGSTRVPPGSTKVPPRFHQGSTSGLGWFEVRFHEDFFEGWGGLV